MFSTFSISLLLDDGDHQSSKLTFVTLLLSNKKNEKRARKMSQEDFNLSNLDDLDLGDFDMDLNLEDMEKVS